MSETLVTVSRSEISFSINRYQAKRLDSAERVSEFVPRYMLRWGSREVNLDLSWQLGARCTGKPWKAQRVLKTLNDHQKKEAVVLHDRIAECQAASDLSLCLPGMAVATIKQNLILLNDYQEQMPFEMRSSVVSQLLIGKFQECMDAARTDAEKASELAIGWVEALALYLPSVAAGTVTVERIDAKRPLLMHLVQEMEQQSMLETDPSVFFAGEAGTGAAAEDSDDDGFFSKPMSSKGETKEDKDKQQEEDIEMGTPEKGDETRSWKAWPQACLT